MRDLGQIMCHHTYTALHCQCAEFSVKLWERGFSVRGWWGCILCSKVIYTEQYCSSVQYNDSCPASSLPPLPSAIIQRYLQATFIYTDHRNIIARSVSEGIMILYEVTRQKTLTVVLSFIVKCRCHSIKQTQIVLVSISPDKNDCWGLRMWNLIHLEL